MPNLRLRITDSELTDNGILVKEITIFDKYTGDEIKKAKLNEAMRDFLNNVEIEGFKDFFKARNNKKLMLLCETFKLYKQ